MLSEFFNPSSVAVIGASHKKGKIGHTIFNNFSNGTFSGKIYAVNQDSTPIDDNRVYQSVKDIPGNVDLAVIATPAKTVPSILKECVEKNVKSAIVISSGFSETGKDGSALEEECKGILKGSGMRVMGPNGLGVYNSSNGVDTMFLPEEKMGRPKKGGISIISQSGAIGASMLDWLSEQSIGVSKFVSYGNAMDVNELDILEYLSEDDSTKVIVAYMEGIKCDGKRFIKTVKKISRRKPVIVLKSGKTDVGKEAASSHTGSLAGHSEVYSAAFKQAGMIETDNWIEMFDMAQAFACQPLPRGNKLLIVTNGGGFGVLAADEAARSGVVLKNPSKGMKDILKDELPGYASLKNPIDIMGDADSERYERVIKEGLKEYDGVLVIVVFQTVSMDDGIIRKLSDISEKSDKPIFLCAAGGKYTSEMSKKMRDSGIPVYVNPERAVNAFSRMFEHYGRNSD